MISVLEDIRNIKSGRKELREFALTIGAILTVLFYVIITPIGVLMKLFGKDVLDERISKNCPLKRGKDTA